MWPVYETKTPIVSLVLPLSIIISQSDQPYIYSYTRCFHWCSSTNQLLVGRRRVKGYASQSPTQRSGDSTAWKTNIRSPHGKAANDDAVGPDGDEDDRDDDFESGGQSLGSESSGGSDSDASGAADDKGDEGPHRKDGRV